MKYSFGVGRGFIAYELLTVQLSRNKVASTFFPGNRCESFSQL